MPRGDDWPGRPGPVLVFDLDGTVLRVNSFPHWVLFLILGRMRGIGVARRSHLARRAVWLLLLRKLRRIDHAALLAGLQRAWREIFASAAGAHAAPLQTRLLRRVRPALRPLLQKVASGDVDAVLATAAAGEYAEGLGRRLGFRNVLTTPMAGDGVEPINSGVRKRDGVLAFLDEAGWSGRHLILLTDHIDDLPLMRVSSLVLWFGPAERAREARDATDGVDFVLCREFAAPRILAVMEGVNAFASGPAPQAAQFSSITAS